MLWLLIIVVVAGVAAVLIKQFGGTKPPKQPEPNRPAPAQLSVSLPALNAYPHDTLCYTEGMEMYKGMLYESGGEYGGSFLAAYDYKTGKQLKKEPIPKEVFAEGITILNDKLYMLTYKENKMFVYDPNTLKLTGEFPWPHGQGWGMTNDGKSIIANTGGSNIFFLDPANLKVLRSISVTDEYGPVSNVNEMEYVNGFIYANVFMTDIILKIDAQSGNVVARADLSGLYPEFNHFATKGTDNEEKLMNGIAYDTATKRFLLTGKMWPKMFEVTIN